MKNKIYKEKGKIGCLKKGRKPVYTDKLGIEWVKKEDIVWKN